MDTLKELLQSLTTHLRERVSNPLYGAFIISWIVFNFRLLMVLVGDGGFREKIEFIDFALYPTAELTLQRGFVYPLLVASTFVVIAPLVRRWVAVFTGERDAITTAELLRVAGKTPLSPEKADALRQYLSSERQRHVNEKRALDVQVLELNAEIQLLYKKQSEASATSAKVETERVEEGKDSGRVVEIAATDRLTIPLIEADFVGGAQKYVIKLAQAGLPLDCAEALFAVRNGSYFDHVDLAKVLKFKDRYSGQLILDRLQGFGLVEFTGTTGKHKITSLGRQALAAALSRGFNPNEEALPALRVEP